METQALWPAPTGSVRGRTAEAFVEGLRRDARYTGRVRHARREEERPAEALPLPEALSDEVQTLLRKAGRDSLYRHQQEAVAHALAGQNVVIATETSSGKSLCFQLPALNTILADPSARALFIFPTNPLANDQEESLRKLTQHLPGDRRPRVVRLQGGMGARKGQMADEDPQIVLTNPEMAHLHLLPMHQRWQRFWRGLRYIVVDEIHLYRGAFGGHLANVLRRVRRCAWRYGAKPTVIAASATVGNPKALAEELCAAPFELVDRSTAPRGPRTTVLWKPPEDRSGRLQSHIDESVLLFQLALEAGLQSILFARSRQLVELMVSKLEENTGKSRIQLGVRAYRAGYLREEREVIEQGLRNGSVRGVVTTNALEVGIDIGSLDVCVIAGYPGSTMALRQQSGRVGRRDRSSAIFVVASANPLDTFLLQHPEKLLTADVEQAVVGRLNPLILRAHLASAAAEFPLWEAEIDRLGGDIARRAVADLIERDEAHREDEGGRSVLVAHGRPQMSVSLRSASQERWSLVGPEGDTVGELDATSIAREAFPGAIYLHQGRAFRVKEHDNGRILLTRAKSGLSTHVQGEREVSVGDVLKTRTLAKGLVEASLARVDVVDRYSSYIESGGGRKSRARFIEPPMEAQLKTEGLVLRFDDRVTKTISGVGLNIKEALHAAEHMLGALCATIVLCDRDDIEGNSNESRIVLFDRFPGGMGLASTAFDSIESILDRAGETLDACHCSDGCPGCVHASRCLEGNEDVSKRGGKFLLRLLRGLAEVSTVEPVPTMPRPKVQTRLKHEREERPVEAEEVPTESAFAPGDRVEHSVYGVGRVLEIRPSGRVVVDFGDGKARRITKTWLRKASS